MDADEAAAAVVAGDAVALAAADDVLVAAVGAVVGAASVHAVAKVEAGQGGLQAAAAAARARLYGLSAHHGQTALDVGQLDGEGLAGHSTARRQRALDLGLYEGMFDVHFRSPFLKSQMFDLRPPSRFRGIWLSTVVSLAVITFSFTGINFQDFRVISIQPFFFTEQPRSYL